MNRWKLVALIFAAFALFATACGGDDGDDTAEADTAAVDTGADAEEEADAPAESDEMDEADDEEMAEAEEEPAEEAMEEEEPAAAGGAGTGGDLLLLQWQAPSQANPHLSSGTKDVLAASLVLEPLARINPDGQMVPRLAAEIPTAGNGISDDGMQITWKLRDDIVWSDGTPFTSVDAVFTWEYCADEATGCTHNNYTNVELVEAIDEHTITVTFKEPAPYPFEPFVGYVGGPIIQEAQFRDCIGDGSAGCSDQNTAPIGTGPFMITELRPEDTVVYTMNPQYRGVSEGKPYFGGATIKGGGDAEAAARSVLEIGEADFAWNLQVAPEILGPMEAAGQGRVAVAFTSNVEHLNLNQTNNRAEGDDQSNFLDGNNPHPVFTNNAEFAKALSLAIDRDLLVQVGYGANGRPTCNIWNVGSQTSSNNDWCLTRDVDQANEILDGLGYVDTDGDGIRETDDGVPLEFSYATSTNAVRQSNQEVIKANFEEIGVAVDLKNEDASLFFDGTNAQGLSIWHFFNDIEMFTNGPDNPDPAGYLGNWESKNIPTLETAWGGNNIPRMNSEEFDKLMEELSSTPLDDPGRDDLAIRANDIISAESGAVVPLILRGSVSAFSSDIENTGPLNGWDSEYWNIEEWTRAG